MSNPKFQITIDVEVDAKTTQLSAREHAEKIVAAVRRAVGGGLLTAHEPAAEIDTYSVDYTVIEEDEESTAPTTLLAGTLVQIEARRARADEAHLLSYAGQIAVLGEDCVPGTYAIVDLQDGTSVYAFSVKAVEATAEFDPTTFHDFVSAHGLGSPTLEGYQLGETMLREGFDYAHAAAEVIARDLIREQPNVD